MKTLTILALLLCLSPALHSTTANADTPPNHDEEGGIDGGGGGTLPIDPASVHQVRDQIRMNARRDLRLYLKFAQLRYKPEFASPAEKKAFGGARTLWDVMESTDIEVRMTEPCYNATHEERDGSIYANRPNAVCISAFRIAPKVDEDDARAQTTALILHELSHLLGTSEDEAKELQHEAVRAMKKWDDKAPIGFVDAAKDATSYTSQSLGALLEKLEKNPGLTDVEVSAGVEDVKKNLQAFTHNNYASSFSLFNLGEYDNFIIQNTRLLLAGFYAQGVADPTGRGQYARDQIDKVFQNDEVIRFSDFEKRYFGTVATENMWKNEPVRRIRDRAGLKAALIDLRAYIDGLNTYAEALHDDLAVGRQKGPWSQTAANPFEKFIGSYKVTAKNCDDAGSEISGFVNLTGIKIYKPEYAAGRLMLQRQWDQSFSDDSAFDGGSDVLGGAAVTVDGDDVSATRKAELGEAWGRMWIINTSRMEKTSAGFTLILSTFERDRMNHDEQESSGTCRLTLEAI